MIISETDVALMGHFLLLERQRLARWQSKERKRILGGFQRGWSRRVNYLRRQIQQMEDAYQAAIDHLTWEDWVC